MPPSGEFGLGFEVPGRDERPGHLIWDGPDCLRAEATPAIGPDGRIYFTEVRVGFIDDQGAVGSDELRAVAITSMLTAANGGLRIPVLKALVAHGDPEMRARARDALDDADAALHLFGDNITELTARRPETVFNVAEGKKPDAFYRQVAAVYTWLVEKEGSRRPVAQIAEMNDAPVATVRRWIREARRRGVLGPGVKGRAGL